MGKSFWSFAERFWSGCPRPPPSSALDKILFAPLSPGSSRDPSGSRGRSVSRNSSESGCVNVGSDAHVSVSTPWLCALWGAQPNSSVQSHGLPRTDAQCTLHAGVRAHPLDWISRFQTEIEQQQEQQQQTWSWLSLRGPLGFSDAGGERRPGNGCW